MRDGDRADTHYSSVRNAKLTAEDIAIMSLDDRLKFAYDQWHAEKKLVSLEEGYPWHKKDFLRNPRTVSFLVYLFHAKTTPTYFHDDELIDLMKELNIYYAYIVNTNDKLSFIEKARERSLMNITTKRKYDYCKSKGYINKPAFGFSPLGNLSYLEWHGLNYCVYRLNQNKDITKDDEVRLFKIVASLAKNKEALRQVLSHQLNNNHLEWGNIPIALFILLRYTKYRDENQEALPPRNEIDFDFICTLLKYSLGYTKGTPRRDFFSGNHFQHNWLMKGLFNVKHLFFGGKNKNLTLLIDYIINLPNLDERRLAIEEAMNPYGAIYKLYQVECGEKVEVGIFDKLTQFRLSSKPHFLTLAEPILKHALAQLQIPVSASVPSGDFVLQHAPIFFKQMKSQIKT